MKRSLLIVLLSATCASATHAQQLNGVTFGFGAGYSHTFDKTHDYSLTTDGTNSLKMQPLNQNAFVISSVVMVKLGKLFVDADNKLLKTNNINKSTGKAVSTADEAGFLDKLSVNLSLNLLNIASDVSFNKSIDGGLGVGYFLSNNLQAGLFYDITQKRQLRDHIVESYLNKPIPNGSGVFYNALDTNDDKLFYNKTVSGLSFKLIFSLANKKQE